MTPLLARVHCYELRTTLGTQRKPFLSLLGGLRDVPQDSIIFSSEQIDRQTDRQTTTINRQTGRSTNFNGRDPTINRRLNSN